jgi:epoxyqueuosine reductase
VRWTTVLTNAPLIPTGQSMEQRCGDCHECVDACPVSAFTGRNFVNGEPRIARFDAARCDSYFTEMEKEREVASCGMCLYICPHGRRRSEE